MDHVAIMKKSLGFLEKILSGEKTIESRWYMSRRAPWGRIKKGERVFFKNTGQPVSVLAKVDNVLEYEGLTPEKIRKIIDAYGSSIGIEKGSRKDFSEQVKDKKYCILIFLKNPQTVKPFDVDKRGFGAMSAWITVENIDKIKILNQQLI